MLDLRSVFLCWVDECVCVVSEGVWHMLDLKCLLPCSVEESVPFWFWGVEASLVLRDLLVSERCA